MCGAILKRFAYRDCKLRGWAGIGRPSSCRQLLSGQEIRDVFTGNRCDVGRAYRFARGQAGMGKIFCAERRGQISAYRTLSEFEEKQGNGQKNRPGYPPRLYYLKTQARKQRRAIIGSRRGNV